MESSDKYIPSLVIIIVVVVSLRLLFNFYKRKRNPVDQQKDILHRWEDDYLMKELLPKENLEFVKGETMRISKFGEEHATENGFTACTPIGDKPFPTAQKQIPVSQVEQIMASNKITKIHQFVMQGMGLINSSSSFYGYGTNKYVLLFDVKDGIIEHISLEGNFDNEVDKQKATQTIYSILNSFGFIFINWFTNEYSTSQDTIEHLKKCL